MASMNDVEVANSVSVVEARVSVDEASIDKARVVESKSDCKLAVVDESTASEDENADIFCSSAATAAVNWDKDSCVVL